MRTFKNFLLLGAVSTLIDYLVYSLMLWGGIYYIYAITLGYVSGFIANFYGGRIFIFTAGAKVKRFGTEITAVFVIAFLGLLINIAIVKLLSYTWLEWDPHVSRLIGIGIAFFWNYAARKFFVYH